MKEKQEDSIAVSFFYNTIKLDTTHQQALLKVSRNALNQGRFLIAEKYSLQGLKTNPANVSLLSILAQAYYRRKQYELAVPQFEKLLDLEQASEFVHISLGMSYYRLEKPQKAIAHYNKALEFEDRNPQTHLNLGRLYSHTGDNEKAETHLLTAILLKKQLLDAEYLSLALNYRKTKDFKKALKYVEQALEENPQNERALYERAVIADNYYEDFQTRINYYQAYLRKYESIGDNRLMHLAKSRLRDLKADFHHKP